MRNRKHMEAIMNRIDRNLDAKGRLDYSDRLTPGFVAALADPITYVPIPFAKGIGFFKGAAKAGTIGAGLIGATEVPRIALDPTATYGESVANMSFDSTGQPTFDGTDDKISTGITTQLEDFSCVVVFKNNNSATWGRIVDKSYTTGFFISPRWNGNASHVGAGVIEPNAPHGQHLSYDNTKYNYFAVTRDGGTHTIYLNGSSKLRPDRC